MQQGISWTCCGGSLLAVSQTHEMYHARCCRLAPSVPLFWQVQTNPSFIQTLGTLFSSLANLGAMAAQSTMAIQRALDAQTVSEASAVNFGNS